MARILSAENITVTVDSNATTASMNVETRRLTLPNFDPALTTEAITDGLIIHEVGHAIFTPPSAPAPKDEPLLRGFIEIMKNAGLPYPKSVEACRRSIKGLGSFYQMLFGIFNVVEDSRIERMMGRKYAGASRFLGAMYREMATKPKIPQLKDLQKLLDPNYLATANLVDRLNVAIKFPMVNFRMEQWERDLVNMVSSTETFQDTIDATIEVAKHVQFPPFNYDPQTGDDANQNIPKQWMNPEDFNNVPEDAKDNAQSSEGNSSDDSESDSSPKSDSDSDSEGSSGKSSKSDKSKSSKSNKSKSSKSSKSDSADSGDDSDDDSDSGAAGSEDSDDDSSESEGAAGSEDSDDDSGESEGAAGSEDSDDDSDEEGSESGEGSESDSADGDDAEEGSESDGDETGETEGDSEGDESGESEGEGESDSDSDGDSTDADTGEVSEGSESDNGNQVKTEGGKATGDIGMSNFDPNKPSLSDTMDRLARQASKASDGLARNSQMYQLPKYDDKGDNSFNGFIYDYPEVLENAGNPGSRGYNNYWYNAQCKFNGSAGAIANQIARINALARKMNTRFNRDKAAKVFANTQTARTGRLDMVKLSQYQTQDDIFVRSQIEKTGKNHGVMIFLDWSGSMSSVASAVIFQAAVYAKFCSLAGIPYDIYLFTDGNEPYASRNKTMPHPSGAMGAGTGAVKNRTSVLTPKTRLVNLFSSRMNAREFSQMTKYLMNPASNFWTGSKYGAMGGTPLDATILIAFSMALAKQKDWKIDVGNLIVISDGEGSGAVPGNLVNPLNPLKPIMIMDSASNYRYDSVPYVGTKATIKLMQLFKRFTQWNTMSIYIDSSSGSPSYFAQDFKRQGGKPEMGPSNEYASCRLPDYGGYDKNFVVSNGYLMNKTAKGCFFELLAGDIAKHIIDDINNDWEHA